MREVQHMYVQDVQQLSTLLTTIASQEQSGADVKASLNSSEPATQHILQHATQTLKTMETLTPQKQ